jgi:chemotaxis protein MotB
MKMNGQIKHSKGILAGGILPLIILTATGGGGWYLFYDEQKSNQAFNLSTQKDKKNLETELQRSLSDIDVLESRQLRLSDQNKSLNEQIVDHQQGTDTLKQRTSQLEDSLSESGKELTAADERSGVLEIALAEERGKLQLAVENTARLENDMQQMIEQVSVKSNNFEIALAEERKKLQLAVENTARLENDMQQMIEQVSVKSNDLEIALAEERKKLQLAVENTARLENDMQQMIEQVSVKSNDLQKQLEQRQVQQALLSSQIDSVSDEKQALLHKLQDEQQRGLQLQNQVAQVNQNIDNKTEALSDAAQGLEHLQTTLDETRVQKDHEAAEFAALKKQLEQELNQTQVQVTLLKNQMRVINLTSEVLFNSGSAQIKPAGQKVLALIASTLSSYPNRQVFIEGHTDDIPMNKNGAYRSNWELSSARAISAVEILRGDNQVSPERLKVVGHGEFKPVTSNETAEGRRLNRRIEIRLMPEPTS